MRGYGHYVRAARDLQPGVLITELATSADAIIRNHAAYPWAESLYRSEPKWNIDGVHNMIALNALRTDTSSSYSSNSSGEAKRVIYKSLSLINHSCRPNAVVYRNGRLMAIQPIANGNSFIWVPS